MIMNVLNFNVLNLNFLIIFLINFLIVFPWKQRYGAYPSVASLHDNFLLDYGSFYQLIWMQNDDQMMINDYVLTFFTCR